MKQFTHKIALLLIATLLLGWMFRESAQLDVNTHLAIMSKLEQLKKLDNTTDTLILKSYYGRLNNNSDISSIQEDIKLTLQSLKSKHPEYFSKGNTDIQLAFTQYQSLIAEKYVQIKQFNAHNANLKDALRDFPARCQQLLGKLDTRSEQASLIRELRENILLYVHTPSKEVKAKTEQLGHRLQLEAIAYNSELDHLTNLAESIINNKIKVDALAESITASATPTQAAKLLQTYNILFAKQSKQSRYYELAITLLSFIMLLYLAWMFTRLQATSQTLSKSLKELEFQKFALDQHSIVSIADQEGKITYSNDKFSEISQYSKEELLGNDYRLVNSGFHPSDFFKQLWETIQNGQVWHGEIRNKRKDGSYYWVDSTIVPLMDKDGKPKEYISIRTDITSSKALNEHIINQRAFYENIIETLGEGLYVQDAKGLCVYMNSEAEKLLGWSREEMLGRPVHDTIHTQTPDGHDLPAHDCPIMNDVKKFGKAQMDNQVFVRKDGSVFPVTLSSRALLDANGHILNTVVAFQDISERKASESSVIQAKDSAERANRVKSDFLANMSHEIRTPMNGIIGMADLALDTDLTPEQREYINIVKTSADALLDIINDILDFSKIESGKMDMEAIYFSLEQMLRDTVKSMAARAHQKKLELLLHVTPDVPDKIIGDPGRLRQVLINLIGNAIKFTESGEIEVHVKKVDGALMGNAKLEFSVRDTGIGIPEDKFQTIFESFSQADTSITRKYGGTGLGLSISNKIIDMMGGQLSLQSKVGVGSTFYFTIDVPVISNESLVQYQEPAPVKGMAVLVVDDNTTNQKILQEMLQNWGMLPTIASCGKDALTALEKAADAGQPYQLVILDVQMPEMSGFELVEHMRNAPEQKPATVMMLTSAGNRGDAARCRELGISGYLMKPVSQSDLFDAIMTALKDALLKEPPHSGANQNDVQLITRHSLRESKRKLNILLAEDNLVNQTLAMRILEKLGHQVTIANNGVEAVQHWENTPFDTILMDIDMPVMGGYEATKVIREKEQNSGKHIAIIAMTAHAMQGAREECVSQGMDGYVSKPIDTKALWRELDKVSQNQKYNEASASQPSPEGLSIVDFGKARQTTDNSQELFDEIVRLFLRDAPEHMKTIKNALNTGDNNAIRHSAHAIKGMVGIFAAERTAHFAEWIERNIGITDVSEATTTLENALNELEDAIKHYRWE